MLSPNGAREHYLASAKLSPRYTWYTLRCRARPAELPPLTSARQGHKQDAPVWSISDHRNVGERLYIDRILQRTLKRQVQRKIGIGGGNRRQGNHRADFLRQEIGHRERTAGRVGADQRAGQEIVGH